MTAGAFSQVGAFHHSGIAVKDFERPLKFYESIGYMTSQAEGVRDELQKVDLCLLTHETFPAIELVKPYDDESPVNGYLKRNRPTIYHFCFEVERIEEAAEILKRNNKLVLLSAPKPAILFKNRLVSFYYIRDVGLIELLEKRLRVSA